MSRSPAPGFPLDAAAVDVGSNAIRFLAARFHAPTRWTVLDAQRAPVRVGRGVFASGEVGAETTEAAAAVLAGFAGRMRELGVARYRAVATSAVRESTDRERFVQRVAQRSGLRLEVIDGGEEARLGWVAVRTRVPLGAAPWLVTDLGGGSLEISLMDARGIRSSESRRLGAVRLLAATPRTGVEELHGLRDFVQRELHDLRPPTADGGLAGMAALGGNIEALARLAGAAPDPDGVSLVPRARLRELQETLAEVPLPQRAAHFALPTDRADVVLAGAVIYEHIAGAMGMEQVHVPHVGVKEGILVDIVERALRGGAA